MKSVNKFPLLERYRKVFPNTPKNVVYAYDNEIYCDSMPTVDVLVHETVHINRQNDLGLDVWVELYLTDTNFRLKEELLAYKKQLKVFPDRNERYQMKIEFAKALSSQMYGSIISFEDALKIL